MIAESMRRQAARAIGLIGLGSGVGKLLSVLTTILMARLLTPSDYGLMALASVVIGLVGFFNEVGLGAAIVQKPAPSDAELKSCFVLSLGLSSLLAGVTAVLAWPAAVFYGAPELQKIITVLGCTFVLGGLNTVPVALLRKSLRFRPLVQIGVVSALVNSAVALTCAFAGLGVWSLVAGGVAGQLNTTIQLMRTSNWRPRGQLELRAGLELMRYGLSVTYSRVLWYVYSNADKAIIGKLLGQHAVGVYDMAASLATLPTSQITGIVTNVSSPVFARLQHAHAELVATLLGLSRGVAYLTFPMLGGLCITAPDLVVVVLGEQWLGAVLPMQALCLLGLIRTVDPLLSQVLISTGNARILIRYTGLCALVMPLAVLLGGWLDGMRGIAIAWLLAYPLLSLRLLGQVAAVIGLPLHDYYRNLAPVLAAVAMMAVVVEGARYATADWGAGSRLALSIAVGGVSYLGWMIFVHRQGLADVRRFLLDLGVAERRLNRWPLNRVGA